MTATPAQAVATQVTQRMQPVGGVPVHAVAAVISLLYAGRVARGRRHRTGRGYWTWSSSSP